MSDRQWSPDIKDIGDKKKFVYDDDLAALVEGRITEVPETWSLEYLNVTSGNQTVPTATVRLKKVGKKGKGEPEVLQDAGIGDGEGTVIDGAPIRRKPQQHGFGSLLQRGNRPGVVPVDQHPHGAARQN